MAILEKVDKLHHATAWRGDMPITNRYTAGIAGERFFRAIKDEGRILGTQCHACDLIYVPATMFCERCFAQLDDWIEVPNRGTVFTYTVLHHDMDGQPLETPAILSHVKLSGTDGGLVHFLGEVDAADIYIGMEVEPVFKEADERQGSILDILHFRPVED